MVSGSAPLSGTLVFILDDQLPSSGALWKWMWVECALAWELVSS